MDNEVKEFKVNYSNYTYMLNVIIRQQRELGFTNKDMARKLNIHPSSYERIIKGKFMMTVIQLFRVCNVLGLNLDIYSTEDSTSLLDHSQDKSEPHEVLEEIFYNET